MKFHYPAGPDGWHAAVSGYAFSFSLSLFITPSVFRQPAFAQIARMGPDAWVWAALLLGYAMAGTFCLFWGDPKKRAAWGICGTVMWGFIGYQMTTGSLISGIVSPAGLFEGFLSVGCFLYVLQSTSIFNE